MRVEIEESGEKSVSVAEGGCGGGGGSESLEVCLESLEREFLEVCVGA